MPISSQSKKRFALIDSLRGFLFINMAAYHALYDWVFLFGQGSAFMYTNAAYLWQQCICISFILLSGISWNLSRHPLRNGIRLFLAGLLITLATALFTPQELILFGILSFLGSAYFLTGLFQKQINRCSPFYGLLVSMLLFALCKPVPWGSLGFLDYKIWTLPPWLYTTPFTFWIGFPHSGFYSSDYFPLLPWLFLYTAGIFCGKLLFQALKKPPVISQPTKYSLWRFPVLQIIGQHTLPLYMVHQPFIFVLFNVYFFIFKAA